MSTLTTQVGEVARSRLAGRVLWSRELGIGRTLLALSTFGTILATPTDILLRDPNAFTRGPVCSGFARASVFCVFGSGSLDLGRNLALLVLLVVAYGWRPRVTCVPHWWVSWSLFVASVTADGGDQAAAILTLFLIPVGLTDSRTWHWLDSEAPPRPQVRPRHVVAASGLIAIQVQVAVIYLHAGIAKFGQVNWANGTAAYYWLQDPRFGAVSVLRGLLDPVLATGLGVLIATYSVVVIELSAGFGWATRGNLRRATFCAAVALHAAIAVFMGLPSFGLAMTGALVLYLFANDGAGGVGRRVRVVDNGRVSGLPRPELSPSTDAPARARRDSNPQPPGP